MTITRVINGAEVAIELTQSELWWAFEEEQKNCDRADIVDYLDQLEDSDFAWWGVSKAEAFDAIERMVVRMDRNRGNDDHWTVWRDDAIEQICLDISRSREEQRA